MNTYFAVNDIKIYLYSFGYREGDIQQTTNGNSTPTIRNHITSSHPHVNSSLLYLKNSMLQTLVKEGRFENQLKWRTHQLHQ